MKRIPAILAPLLVALAACSDHPTRVSPVAADPSDRAIAATVDGTVHPTSTARWNRKAIALFRTYGGAAGRINAYLSVAQYRAILAAGEARQGQTRPSLAGASAGASAVVLAAFFPLAASNIDADLAAQRAEPPVATERNLDFEAGEAIGRAVAASVLAWAATDNFGVTAPAPAPVGPGYWFSSGAPVVRGGLGARPFFLTSQTELLWSPPPAFNSAEFNAALAEVRALTDARTPEQTAIVLKWVPFSGVILNGVATDLIDRYRRSELEAARILAYANTAAFDAIIGCFVTKYTYWLIRPSQADPGIVRATALPNHPSYPSAHSCETGAITAVLEDAFPQERAMLQEVANEASMSRVIGGLHYRFDGDAGLSLGREAARLALQRRGIE